jgi:hypothetical protein
MAERTQDYDEERLHRASPLMLGRADVGREVTARDREAIYGAYDLEISLAWRKNLSGGKARGVDPVASATPQERTSRDSVSDWRGRGIDDSFNNWANPDTQGLQRRRDQVAVRRSRCCHEAITGERMADYAARDTELENACRPAMSKGALL